jgi:hypothetical protein
MEKKQTAVEWLAEEINKNGVYLSDHYWNAFEQAKQMEKEQIVNAYWDGGQDVPMHISTCENYYNETFGVETGVIVFDNIHLTNTNKINNGGNNE